MGAPCTLPTDPRRGDITIQAVRTSRTGHAAKLKALYYVRRVGHGCPAFLICELLLAVIVAAERHDPFTHALFRADR